MGYKERFRENHLDLPERHLYHAADCHRVALAAVDKEGVAAHSRTAAVDVVDGLQEEDRVEAVEEGTGTAECQP